ncbi:MAG: DUF6794 domain-containing protein [Candidatus Thermoplasmatota archaeon]
MKKVGYATLDDVLDDLLSNVPGGFKEKVKTMTRDEFIVKQHFNLGMTIKEKYFYRNRAQEQLIKSLGLGDKKEYRFFDGDVFSQLILEALWKKITTGSTKQS